MTTERESIALPAHLYERIERRVSRTDFDSPDEYVTFVLEEVLANVEEADIAREVPVDDSEIEARLRSLGYLDG